MQKTPSKLSFKKIIILLIPIFIGMLFGLLWQGLKDTADKNNDFPMAGQKFPDINLTDLWDHKNHNQKTILDLADGKIIILNVFASWCIPCEAEMPILNAVKEKHNNILWLGINWQDKKQDGKNFLTHNPNPFDLVLWDGDGRAMLNFGLAGVPETYIIDSAGIVRLRHVGAILDENDLLTAIEKLQ